MAIVVFGTVALDTVKTPFGERQDVLGGSGTYASYSAGFFTEVGLVGIVGDDFSEEHLKMLRQRHVDTTGVEVAPGKTFRWKGLYEYDMNEAKTIETQLNTLDKYMPKIPDTYRDYEYILLANNDPDMQVHALEQMHQPRLVICDTMNLWIDIKKSELKRLLGMVDVIILNDGEARQYTGQPSLVKAASMISAEGPKSVIIKKGEHGALLYSDGRFFAVPGFPLEEIHDPTGAGDTFAGGFVGYLAKNGRLTQETLRRAVVYGSVMASFNVEKFSLERLITLTEADIKNRYDDFVRLTHFELPQP